MAIIFFIIEIPPFYAPSLGFYHILYLTAIGYSQVSGNNNTRKQAGTVATATVPACFAIIFSLKTA
jgi:hypothetical protein